MSCILSVACGLSQTAFPQPDRPLILDLGNGTTPCTCLTRNSLIPLADARLIAMEIPGARLAIIPAAGHLSNLEQPDVFNELVERFIEGLG